MNDMAKRIKESPRPKAHTIISFDWKEDLIENLETLELDWKQVCVVFEANAENIKFCKSLFF
jgi:hypothetical protein